MNKTRETVRTNLRTLEEKKLVKRIGADKNGHWEILVNADQYSITNHRHAE